MKLLTGFFGAGIVVYGLYRLWTTWPANPIVETDDERYGRMTLTEFRRQMARQ